jgi:isoaspartyl peptidase/L-asparaginase-like protein (Ntn-hydrolase superfamily)
MAIALCRGCATALRRLHAFERGEPFRREEIPLRSQRQTLLPGELLGSGGLVSVGHDGALALPFNCSGMYRGFVRQDGAICTAIHDDPYRTE